MVLPSTVAKVLSLDSSLISTGFLQCFNTVSLVMWLVKIVPEMTYNVSSGTLSLYTTTTTFAA